MSRAFILLLDSFGLGALPDADKYGDAGANTFGHIAAWAAKEGKPMALPNLERLGLAAAAHKASGEWAAGFSQREGFTGAWGVAREQSTGKDTQSGHWEIAGVPVLFDWGYFPKTVPSFPKELTDKLQELTGVPGWLGNCHASGTTIIDELGDEHVATGKPILYTSADSVLQIAAHEEHFGLERLYEVCEVAYELVKPYNIGRVIARPFLGENGKYKRTSNRHDYAVPPTAPTLLDHVKNAGGEVIALGKISDIFAAQGVTQLIKGADNMALFDRLVEADGGVTFEIQGLGHSSAVPFESGLTPRCLARVAPMSEKVFAIGSSCGATFGPKKIIGMCSRVWSEPGAVGSQPWSAVMTTRSPSFSLAMNSGRRASSSCSALE